MLYSQLTAICISLVSGTLTPVALQTPLLQSEIYRPEPYFRPLPLTNPPVDGPSIFTTVHIRPFVNNQKQPDNNRAGKFNPPFIMQKKHLKKYPNEAKWHIARLWVSSDITRLFVPNLQNLGVLNLHLHYSLKRSPYLLLHYEAVTIKTKLKSNGMLQNEIYYNLGVDNAQLGIKIRNQDPQLYFRYRFN